MVINILSQFPHVVTKPFHHSQEIVEQHPDRSVTISVRVSHNFEFERLILGFGDCLEVVAPKQLRRRIKGKLKKAAEVYKNQNY